MPRLNDLFAIEAMNEAMKSPLSSKHGALLICGGKIISRGFNHFNGNNMISSIEQCLLCS